MSADLDLTQSIEPRSDQINADDLIAGPMTVTVREVIVGKAEQPFDFLLVETDRAYRPSKTMRRVIVGAWGSEAANYAGRRLTIYREPSIMFGGQRVGGIRVSAMSDISKPVVVQAQTTRGKRETFTVQPLAATPRHGGADAGSGGPASAERSTGTPAVDGRGEHVSAGESPAGQPGEQHVEGAASQEPLLAAITRQIGEIQAEGGEAHLKTWWKSLGIGESKRALVDRFGDDARDLRALMAQEVEA